MVFRPASNEHVMCCITKWNQCFFKLNGRNYSVKFDDPLVEIQWWPDEPQKSNGLYNTVDIVTHCGRKWHRQMTPLQAKGCSIQWSVDHHCCILNYLAALEILPFEIFFKMLKNCSNSCVIFLRKITKLSWKKREEITRHHHLLDRLPPILDLNRTTTHPAGLQFSSTFLKSPFFTQRSVK